MGWVRLDDQRAMNRKLRDAGFAARGLDEAAMCQVAYDKSDGFISEHTVETLAVGHRCKQWRKLAAELVRVGRWEPVDGGWMIHDYLDYNPSRAEWEAEVARKRTAGRRGGQARAQAGATARAQAGTQAPASAQTRRSAEAGGQADPTRTRTPSSQSSRSVNHRRHQADDDDFAEVFETAVGLLAERHLEERTAEKGPVRNPEAWLAADRRRRREEHTDTACQLVGDHPGIDAHKLAELLEPAAGDAQMAAAFHELSRRAELPPCENCDSSGWVGGDPDRGKCEVCRRLLPAANGRTSR